MSGVAFFFLFLGSEQAEKLHSGRWRPQDQLCYKVSLQDMVSVLRGRNGCSDTEPQTGRPLPTRGRQGRLKRPGPRSPMVTEPWTRSPWESLPGSPAGRGPSPGRSALVPAPPQAVVCLLAVLRWFPHWFGDQVFLLLCSLPILSSSSSGCDDVCTLMA